MLIALRAEFAKNWVGVPQPEKEHADRLGNQFRRLDWFRYSVFPIYPQ